MNNEFHTTHNLAFEAAPWHLEPILRSGFKRFRIGTIEGLWKHSKEGYEVLAIENSLPGNGHLQDFLEWFCHSCKRDKCNFVIREFFNPQFKEYLIREHGFRLYGSNDLIKPLHKISVPAKDVSNTVSG